MNEFWMSFIIGGLIVGIILLFMILAVFGWALIKKLYVVRNINPVSGALFVLQSFVVSVATLVSLMTGLMYIMGFGLSITFLIAAGANCLTASVVTWGLTFFTSGFSALYLVNNVK